MEDSTESEQISDDFTYAVCLDVLYKPIVLVCGHVSCFLVLPTFISKFRSMMHCVVLASNYFIVRLFLIVAMSTVKAASPFRVKGCSNATFVSVAIQVDIQEFVGSLIISYKNNFLPNILSIEALVNKIKSMLKRQVHLMIFPIVGDRYKCKDCTEKSGYDLCGDCYNTGSNVPGRFNQKHTPTHRLELVNQTVRRNIMYWLLGRRLAVVSAFASTNPSSPGNNQSDNQPPI